MKTQDFFDHENLRSKVYRLLANGFYLPVENLFKNMTELAMCMEQVGCEIGKGMCQIEVGTEQFYEPEILEVDYARLFVGPFSLLAAPYGSVYIEGQRLLMGNSTADVQKRYQNAGLGIAPDFKDAPDHISAELEFMHFLIFKEIEAIRKEDANDFTIFLNNQQSFLEQHLCAWISAFANNVVSNAQTSFYQNLAKATEAFVKYDYLMVSSILSSWQPDVEKPVEQCRLNTA
jgi:DMSO reductase family type II enzyme chaperone